MGITDHGNMHGAYEMWRTAVDEGIKPIIGIEAYVTPGTARSDKTRVHWGTQDQHSDDVSANGSYTHMTMWAENDEGLVNLLKASSLANLEGLMGKNPRMDREALREAGELQDILAGTISMLKLWTMGCLLRSVWLRTC